MSKSNTFESEQLTDAAYYILLALVVPRHGYAIMQYIDQLTEGMITIGPATLYTLLKKMSEAGYIDPLSGDGRKKQYCIAPKGVTLLKNEIRRRQQMAAHGAAVLEQLEREECSHE